jgi:hypothetical protein
MKTNIITIIFFLLFVACNSETAKEGDNHPGNKAPADQESEIPAISIGDFNSKAGNYVDKKVQVTGIVDHVCRHGGKRILFVDDNGDIHIDSDSRFDEELTGSEISVTGIVRELRIDEAYCLKMEEDNIKSHKNGEISEHQLNRKNEHLQFYRDSMEAANTDHISFYSMDYVSHQIID